MEVKIKTSCLPADGGTSGLRKLQIFLMENEMSGVLRLKRAEDIYHSCSFQN